MTGLFGRGCLKKIKRSELPMGTRVISSRFHYKIKRHSAGEHKLKVKRLKVRLVLQGQHMSQAKGDFTDAFSPVPHLFGVRCCMSMVTAMKLKAIGVTRFHPSRVATGWKGHLYFPASRACRGARCGLSGLEASLCGSMSLSLAALQRSMSLSSACRLYWCRLHRLFGPGLTHIFLMFFAMLR